jgi:hypothetical protein
VRIEDAIDLVEERTATGAPEEVVRGVDGDHADPRAELGATGRVVDAELVHVVAHELHHHVAIDLVEVGAAEARGVLERHLRDAAVDERAKAAHQLGPTTGFTAEHTLQQLAIRPVSGVLRRALSQ